MAKSAAKGGTIHALAYLADPHKYPASVIYVVYGDDVYLKFEAMAALRRELAPSDGDEFSITTLAGREAQLRDVHDALATRSLFGAGKRIVIIEEADPFVSEYRAELEDFVTKASDGATLVLDVKTWPGNTRLAKAAASVGMAIECRSYEASKGQERAALGRQIKTWLTQRAKVEHGVRLESAALDAMLERLPPEVGILAQEVDKLAVLSGENGVIDAALVEKNVGGWRTRATWDMIDAAADGRAAEALAQLGRLIASGEDPQGLLPQMASTLRRFATTLDLVEAAEASRRRLPWRDALAQAGVPPFKLNDAERQLRQLGKSRIRQLTGWLLAADLAVKSHNSADDKARIELERLIVRLAASNVGPPSRGGPVAKGPARLAGPTA